MAISLARIFGAVSAALLISFGPSHVANAATADPCKKSSRSTACKAYKAKQLAAAKTAASKRTAAKTTTKATASKTSAKTTAKSSTKAAAKTTAKTASAKRATKTVAAKSTSKTRAASKTRTRTASKTASRTVKIGNITAKTRTAKASNTRKTLVASAATGAAVASVAPLSPAEAIGRDVSDLRSSTAYVQDLASGSVLFAKNEDVVRPIASISKLMTALVTVEARQPLHEMLEITEDDVDHLKGTSSRLVVGTRLSRADLLHLALMSSENRAANALARNYPGGWNAFIRAMNAKARALGMNNTRFVEPTGLSSNNVSSPRDLARLLQAASQQPLIHQYTTSTEYTVDVRNRQQVFRNTNLLVRKPDWDIRVSKTGYINEAGECLVMMARIQGRNVAIVLLNSQGKYSRIGDAVRIRRILENQYAMAML